MTSLTARFAVEGWEPQAIDGFGDWVGVARMRKTFTSGLVGTSTVLFVTSGVEGTRSYLAAEHIAATTDDGRSGTLTVHHGAVEGQPDSAFGLIVAQSGTDDFAGWSGSARIDHDDKGAFFVFDLT